MALSKVDLANQVENQLPQSLVADNVNFRNIIINGDMSIAQRGTSFSSVSAGNGTFPVDRFRNNMSTGGTWTISQDSDVPSGQGFAKSVKYDCTTANASLSAGSFMIFQQLIEAQNLQYLKYGTANAENLTASFWVKSNKTGTYIVDIYADDGTRQISKSYTIDSANTWEKKTLSFAGDTSGVINNDNGTGFQFDFWLVAGTNYTSGTLNTSWNSNTNANRAVGQVNLADTVSNYINFTGIQLEAGTSASDFEFLPYDVNLQRCYRYYFKHSLGDVGGYGKRAGISTTFAILENSFYTVPMRAAASMSSGTPTFENCSNLTFNSFDGGKSYMCRVTSDNASAYRAYDTTVEHNAEL